MHSIIDNTLAAIGLVPQAASGTTEMDGPAFDTLKHKTVKAVVFTGASSGTPDSFAVVFKGQESADGSTGWTDITGATKTITAVNTKEEFTLTNYAGVDNKRYLRVIATPAFVGGTSPKVQVAACLEAGNSLRDPQNAPADVQAGSVIS